MRWKSAPHLTLHELAEPYKVIFIKSWFQSIKAFSWLVKTLKIPGRTAKGQWGWFCQLPLVRAGFGYLWGPGEARFSRWAAKPNKTMIKINEVMCREKNACAWSTSLCWNIPQHGAALGTPPPAVSSPCVCQTVPFAGGILAWFNGSFLMRLHTLWGANPTRKMPGWVITQMQQEVIPLCKEACWTS